jgi:hypothetical protein
VDIKKENPQKTSINIKESNQKNPSQNMDIPNNEDIKNESKEQDY